LQNFGREWARRVASRRVVSRWYLKKKTPPAKHIHPLHPNPPRSLEAGGFCAAHYVRLTLCETFVELAEDFFHRSVTGYAKRDDVHQDESAMYRLSKDEAYYNIAQSRLSREAEWLAQTYPEGVPVNEEAIFS
jgi:hypothetical protein